MLRRRLWVDRPKGLCKSQAPRNQLAYRFITGYRKANLGQSSFYAFRNSHTRVSQGPIKIEQQNLVLQAIYSWLSARFK